MIRRDNVTTRPEGIRRGGSGRTNSPRALCQSEFCPASGLKEHGLSESSLRSLGLKKKWALLTSSAVASSVKRGYQVFAILVNIFGAVC